MRLHLLRIALALTASTVWSASAAVAQVPEPSPFSRLLGPGASTLRAVEFLPSRTVRLVPDVERGRDHTILGLVVGAGLGFAVGWAFYDVMCEAVENRCSDSRFPHVVVGTALGASLGALVGSTVD